MFMSFVGLRGLRVARGASFRMRGTRFQSTAPNAGPKPQPRPRGVKALMKEYGFSALGVYLALSMLDLPLCYVMVHAAGREKIQEYENSVKQFFGYGKSSEELKREQEITRIHEETEDVHPSGIQAVFPWFSWTEFAIAYGIHKLVFIFVRVPLTAAITPPLVKLMRRWGFKIGSQPAGSFGTPATRRNKWFSWFF